MLSHWEIIGYSLAGGAGALLTMGGALWLCVETAPPEGNGARLRRIADTAARIAAECRALSK